MGGLGGAGLGAIVGNQSGNAGPGAVIGAAAGAITGAVVGNELDEIDARNRAMIEQQMGRSISASAVTINDVMAMTRAGVNDDLIINHVRAHGVAVAPSAQQTIELHQAGVSDRVIKALQTSPPPPVGPPPGPPVIIEEHYYPRPYWPRGYWGGYHYHRRPSWGVGVSVGG